MASSQCDLPPWDPENKDQQTAVCHSEQYKDKLLRGIVEAKKTLILTDIWPHLRSMGVVSQAEKERITVRTSFRTLLSRIKSFMV